MKAVLIACSVLLSVALAAATSNPFCVVSNGPSSTVDLNPILPATYVGTLSSDMGITSVSIDFGWCQPMTQPVCNYTNWTMAIANAPVTTPATCVTAFEVFIGPAAFTNATSTASFQLWGGIDGAVASVTVACDAQGAQGEAKLTGVVINQPIYSYELAFSSVHACASA